MFYCFKTVTRKTVLMICLLTTTTCILRFKFFKTLNIFHRKLYFEMFTFFTDILVKDISGRRDWLKKQSKLKAEEKKRRGSQKTYADIFGMEGSFRQLNID